MRPDLASCATDKGIRPNRNRAFGRGANAVRIVAALALALALPACSITAPIAALSGDDDDVSTGTVRPLKAPLSSRLTVEDWRRAKSALALALDPQGNGTAVSWDNPESKARGSFSADGAFAVRNNLVCRRFKATLKLPDETAAPQGLACRQGPSDWTIVEQSAISAVAADAPEAPSTKQAASAQASKHPPSPRGVTRNTPSNTVQPVATIRPGAIF